MKSRARAVLAAACSIHFVHDGFSDILYVLLPIWANEFRLTFAQVGLIRTAYSGGMAAFQIPAGLLAERWGERRLLAAGTAITACGFIAARPRPRTSRKPMTRIARERNHEPSPIPANLGRRHGRGSLAADRAA